ncbi:oligosaccharyl transferase glycoprotein complex, beta subunit [Lodderomyces elongisporus]|uniref:oligosaccharyl transferase glycoprotein complex, beta subunit n=1 Tax=Lodderomyces elongisporus TaxID=36914 RepID=UPI00291D01DE|nr:oligosaccharyl transferase glycoprotein complex, beta subunit [Lodderomyces elongisporus]WLF77053.1 oligosaccharyl transferase glycoprotein complex, beta subunit [Lodderomyces elongisporus]
MFKLVVLISCFLLSFIGKVAAAGTNVTEIEHALVLFDPELVPLNDSTAQLTPEVSQFLNYLSSKYKVAISDYNDEEVSLFYEDYPRFDHLVLFPTSKKAIKNKANLNQHQLLRFVNEGANVFAISGSEKSTLTDGVRSFLNEVGIYPAPKNLQYTDHFNTKNQVVELKDSENLVGKNRILTSLTTKEYTGSAALITNSELVQPIIKSSKTGYTSKVGEPINGETTWTFGEQGFLAVGFQALNNARVVWIGSSELLADSPLYKWCFQETGVIKLQFVQHVREIEPYKPNPHLYKIKEQAIYSVGVSEYQNGEWVPFEVKNDDEQLQLSFKMLDPYQRLNLKPLGPVSSKEDDPQKLDAYLYSVNFTVPDHHGMFTFELDYKRNGLSYILDKKVVTVRHLANDEFRRSWDITNSWLYVASTVLVIASWYYFVISYIYVGKSNLAKKDV